MAEQFIKNAKGLTTEQSRELLTALKEGIKSLEKELPRKNNMAYAMAAIIGTAITIAKNIVLMIMESQAEDQETKDIATETARNILVSFGAGR